ncbi:hypothetical protein BU23DRAFT_568277 [Bimuria novae-zelandiae CBS 107.79]|uniref:Uncharacterized protein n=1 Tax=Bimuria novae-zelandiae CBS 107.79 TaxID=1447943 RepID=A0A6A5V9V7_9PLEO|nr:hypothetical protein BU23DRAFT_568277 [Bimuria novae-zelandiae CBS 107.79]
MEMAASSKSAAPSARETRESLNLLVLGMCSGAALDSITCALVRYRQQSPDGPLRMLIIKHEEVPVPLQLRTQILNLLRDHPRNPTAMIRVHKLLGYMHSTAFDCFCNNSKPQRPLDSIDLLAVRADSIPPSVTPAMAPTQISTEAEPTFTSWPAVIASKTGITTTSNVSVTRRPVNEDNPTAGPPVDSLLIRHPKKFRVCMTITDLLNITIVPPGEGVATTAPPSSICGPGTMFIEYALRYATSNHRSNNHSIDAFYSQGTVNQSIVDLFLEQNDYSIRVPSLRIATEMFGQHEVQSVIDECLFLGMDDKDTVATITRITAENMVRQYNRLVAAHCPPDHEIDELLICGPGARNMDIVEYLEEKLPDKVITRPLDDIGIPGDAKEAVCCAHLGLETILKFAAKEDGPFENDQQGKLMGSIVKGKHWDTLRDHVMRHSSGIEASAVQRVIVERQ